MLPLSDIGGVKNTKPFGIGSHHAVFNSVVHHLHKMTGAVRAAVQVTLLGCAAVFRVPACVRCRRGPVARVRKWDRDALPPRLAPNHHAVAAFKAPDAAACTDIDIVNAFAQLLRAPDIVYVI